MRVCLYTCSSPCLCAGLLVETGVSGWPLGRGEGLMLSAGRTKGRTLAGASYQDRQPCVHQTHPTPPHPLPLTGYRCATLYSGGGHRTERVRVFWSNEWAHTTTATGHTPRPTPPHPSHHAHHAHHTTPLLVVDTIFMEQCHEVSPLSLVKLCKVVLYFVQ